MTRISLSQAEVRDLEDAMDDPSLSDKHRIKLLVIRMHSKGAKNGFIAKCLKLHANTITNHLKEWARWIKTAPGRQHYSVLGAIESHSHEIISVSTEGTVSAALVKELLEKIRAVHPGSAITLILDNARYQRCKEVAAHAAASDIELLYLPAYSPNLNLIERLWKLTKKKCLTNRHYPSFGEFRHAIDTCLKRMATDYLVELKSLLTLNFQFFPLHETS